MLEGPARFFAAGPLEPLGGVRPMTGLLNRTRRFLDDDDRPLVTGFHAVGDGRTCTNPLYGRGCASALVQAIRLADAIAAHPDDVVARTATFEAACRREIVPWYHQAVEMDVAGSDPGAPRRRSSAQPDGGCVRRGRDRPGDRRGLTRLMNLLATPAELVADAEFSGRVADILADPDAYPLPPRSGPTRAANCSPAPPASGEAADSASGAVPTP